jgi:hypothetical protein
MALQQSFDALQFPVGHQGHGNAEATHATGTTCPVGVDVVAAWCIIINHVTHMGEVEATGGHIGGDHQLDLLAPKLIEDERPLLLIQPAMHEGQ